MDTALDQALLVFRERGFHGASLGELGTAMKLTAGSIYKAFPDKRAIFMAAFDRYTDLRTTRLRKLLDAERTGHEKLRAMLVFYGDSSHGDEGRRGCLVAGAAAELATFDREMADRVTTALDRAEALLRELLNLGQSDGTLSRSLDADATARALLCLLQGFRIVGKTGRTQAEMMAAAEQALRLLT
ncbi:TetR/AcrR family transcriptional regulator [Telmatospirillum siberiense]|uniref:TetR family transcriptional regulator n=1 Tax=Telmatospirillum siberiense TaxID=382514 RepID=A0A2N3PUM0_9PROT|nr:TetR/AcrR family transcriptional regulator [Telmatospirillum siberiense]PKU24096.1 TetR family transcriptional regulator [Telmatospirillum siberiense]